MKSYVLYKRISSKKQLSSGLSIEAQQKLADDFLVREGGIIIETFTEQETASGKRKRPQLDKALKACKKHKSTLLVGNLSRLSRSVYFTSALIRGNVPFICLDMPQADKTMLQMLSIFNEWELDQVSKRTKLALQAAKARGVVLGANGKVLSRKNIEAAENYYRSIKPEVIAVLRNTRKRTLQHYSNKLNDAEILTRNGSKWYPQSVKNMFKHLNWQVKDPSFC